MENKKPTLYYDTIKQHYCLEPEFAGAFAVNDSDSYAIYKENNDFIFRRVNLNAPKTLYHYCSFDTMLKITESNFMRLTSCYDSNDSEELTWALKVLINIVDNYKKYIASQSENDIIISLIELKKNINYILPHCPEELNIALNEAIDELLKTKPNVKINLIKKCDDGLSHILNDVKCILPKQPIHIACFSAEQDYLGQWRAYGDDGKGVAIGFDINFLHEDIITY